MGTAEAPPLPPGLPDDWSFERDLPCPRCRYNLRTLRTPRCPECGVTFHWQALLRVRCPRCGESLGQTHDLHCPRCLLTLEWPRLLGAADIGHLRLFEYSHRPLRAALADLPRLLLPGHFWRRIPLELPRAAQRLKRLSAAALLLGAALVLLACVPLNPLVALREAALPSLVLFFGWPLVTMLALPGFAPTLQRLGIRDDQLLRCAAYALWRTVVPCAIVLAASLLGLLLLGLERVGSLPVSLMRGSARGWLFEYCFTFPTWVQFLEQRPGGRGLMVLDVVGATVTALTTLGWWRYLWVTLRGYLRFRLADALALFASTQVIAVLTIALLLLSPLCGAWLMHALARMF